MPLPKNPTPRSWFYEFPFGCCSDGPLCLKNLHFNKMAAMWRSLHCRVRDHYFFCFWLFFFFVFFTITNTKDPVKKTFCFTGNKNIIYASVKCKNLLPPIHPAKPGLSGVLRNRNTQVTFVFWYTTAVRGMKGQSQQTEPNCFVQRFRCWWINGETDSHVCLCCSARSSHSLHQPKTILTTSSSFSSSDDVVTEWFVCRCCCFLVCSFRFHFVIFLFF